MAYQTLCRCKGFGNIYIDIVQAINGIIAVQPIVEDKYSYMISKIDSKLLKVMKVLGFGTRQIGKSIDYLTSETVPVCFSKRGIMGFFSKYRELCKAA